MRLTATNEKITISIVGAGNRAKAYVDALDQLYPHQFEITALFEPDPKRQKYFQDKYHIKKENIFRGYEDFIKLKRISDIVIIATLDNQHYIPTMHAIKAGYDIILEKPISMSLKETIEIGELGKKHPNQIIAVCHVLRHSPFFRKIKELLDQKVIGDIVNFQHNENVGYYHFAHSYVRGNWRNLKVAAPFIVAKSCHDLDILLYLINKKSVRFSSMGTLSFFTHENYNDELMAPRCQDCKIEGDCPYSALKIYSGKLIRSVLFDNSSVERLKEELSNSPYGRCVFQSDNDVADHQVTIIEFEDGVTATFNLSAFTNKIHRSLKIMGTYGEIRATEVGKIIEVWPFGKDPYYVEVDEIVGGHGGSDTVFMDNFMKSYLYGEKFDSTLAMSIESHVIAYGAEASRLENGKMIETQKFYLENK
ncbi:MAG: Gfo/Idh/MocA family protein [Acholeplasmataceae bacterium]